MSEHPTYVLAKNEQLRRENERLRAALKPFADELDCLEAQGCNPPPASLLMFASNGGGTYMGISVSTFYHARTVLLTHKENQDGRA